MAAKKRMTKKERERRRRRRFWGLVLGVSVLAAVCVLITLGEVMEKPILPTWDEIFQMTGLREPDPLDSEMQVHVIDVGNADALLIRNRGESLLIDAGEKGDGETVVNYLREHGVDKLDIVIATHADADHIGGMRDVVDAFEIGTFLMATMPEGYTPTTKVYTSLLEGLAEKGLRLTPAEPGDSYSLGDAVLDILGPAAEFEDNNNQSVVCRVTFGAKRFLFMGDAEVQAENALLAAGTDLKADVIKIGHHGSDTSTQESLLDAAAPQIALITCGAGNSYGHPDSSVLARLNERGIACYRSDLCGDIVVTTDGAAITVETEKGGT